MKTSTLVLTGGVVAVAAYLLWPSPEAEPIQQTTAATSATNTAMGTANQASGAPSAQTNSPFALPTPEALNTETPTVGPAEKMLDLSALRAQWANDPNVEQKIADAVAITRLQDRVGAIGPRLQNMSPNEQRQTVNQLIQEMNAFAARGVLPQTQVDDVAKQLMAFIEPATKPHIPAPPPG